jgi:iron complex transport system substrate-binding protein
VRRISAIFVIISIIFMLSCCDNAHYTEYGGEITSVTGTDIIAMADDAKAAVSVLEAQESREQSVAESRIADSINKSTSAKLFDRMGEEIEIPDSSERIVSTTPAITEILSGLGIADRIVGADMFSSGIEGVDSDVCTLDMMHLNAQAIADLKPDLVIIGEICGAQSKAELEAMGIFTAYIPTAKSIEAIKMDIEFIGSLTGSAQNASELIFMMNLDLRYIETTAAALETKTVYFEIEEQPNICAVGANTFLADGLRLAGAETVFSDMDGYAFVTTEDIISRAESIDIIFTAVSYEGYDPNEIKDREGFSQIKALREGNFYPLSPNEFLRPSQNITKAFRSLLPLIHPELS